MQVPRFLPRGLPLVYAKHRSLLALMRNASDTSNETTNSAHSKNQTLSNVTRLARNL